MRKNYITLLALLFTAIGFAQNNDFTNGRGDLLWSKNGNWSLDTVPNTKNTAIVRLPLILESKVDSNFVIKKIQTTFSTPGDATVGGTSVLTIDAGANAVQGIENVSNQNINLIFNGNLTINNSTTAGIANTLMRNQNGSGNSITFSENSLLTLTTPLEAKTGSSNNFNFNGSIAGTAPLRVNANTISTFGSTSNNPNFEGDLVWVGANASVIVNSADDNTFLPVDRKIQINAINGSIEVNGMNVYKGNISINGDRSFMFDVNKNQNSIGTITFAGGTANGTLNLDIDTSITELAFANSSEVEWNSGTLNITGYKEGVLRFGTDNTGLTTAQLAQIVVDGVSDAVALNSDGYLVNKTSLSVNDFNEDIQAVAYPTLTSNKIFFSKPQNNVKIVDLNGKTLKHTKTNNQEEISVEFLSSGLYLIVFDNKKIEKFIKK
ncbi:T9SS type A sorting domain-containing protein [Polaribacter sp. M15]